MENLFPFCIWKTGLIISVVIATGGILGILHATRPETPTRKSLLKLIFSWLGLAAAALYMGFATSAFILSKALPEGQWEAESIRMSIPLATALAGAVAIALAIRRQISSDASHDLTLRQGLHERFTSAAQQLGDESPVTRVAGAYSMARLADEWILQKVPGEAQMCIDQLCSYIRSPRPEKATEGELLKNQESAEIHVRSVILSIIKEKLNKCNSGKSSWHGFKFDLSGSVIEVSTFDLSDLLIDESTKLSLRGCKVRSDITNLDDMCIKGGEIDASSLRAEGRIFHISRLNLQSGTLHLTRSKISAESFSISEASLTSGIVDLSSSHIEGSLHISISLEKSSSLKLNSHFISGTNFLNIDEVSDCSIISLESSSFIPDERCRYCRSNNIHTTTPQSPEGSIRIKSESKCTVRIKGGEIKFQGEYVIPPGSDVRPQGC